jgi:hypothetical protein
LEYGRSPASSVHRDHAPATCGSGRASGACRSDIHPNCRVCLPAAQYPLLDLSLLAKPSFGWAICLATCYRFGLVMAAFVVPLALTRLQGFRIEQIADALG